MHGFSNRAGAQADIVIQRDSSWKLMLSIVRIYLRKRLCVVQEQEGR
jgi:hypothetical protein